MLSTVSPTYAKEILTVELGERLEDVLKSRRSRLTGILNGIDQKKYNPVNRSRHPQQFFERPSRGPSPQQAGAAAYVPAARRIRISSQSALWAVLMNRKGSIFSSAIAPALFENIPFQFFLVGTGEKEYRMFFKELQEKYPDRVGAHLFFDEKLPKHIFAGADALIMPSRFEPAGLVQMEAMRYGCIPIVRNTGGLADTVIDFKPSDPFRYRISLRRV